MRDVIVAANWKMHTTPADAGELAATIAARTREAGVTRVICPPFVCLAAVRDALAEADPGVAVGAQNIHHELAGAYTGEVAAPMLTGLAGWVIVGHSERRRDAAETDELIGRKLGRAIDAGLRPILCVGEQLAEREAGRAVHVVDGQLRGALGDRDLAALAAGGLVIAYEPVWAIGTGRNATGADAAAMADAIRASLAGLGWLDPEAVPILYGGSVTSANIGEFLAEPAIDGALVGGASLKPDEMAGIVARAGITARARGPGPGRLSGPAMEDRRPGHRRPRPIVLVILDGFGIGRDPTADAIAAADMPTWRALLSRWPHSVLRASEDAVGLPAGQMGNSEVGHLNLGAGKPVLQDLPRIDAAIADGSFFERPALLAACDRALHTGEPLHIVGLVGPGGVHAHDRHLHALVELAARRHVPSVRLHALLDGRDTPPASALGFVEALGERLRALHPDARIATVGGRYFAMDRDKRWDRVEAGYDAIVHGEAVHQAASATEAIEAAYARGETDEFVVPTVVGDPTPLHDHASIVHANFRADRARQLTHALADGDGFTAFDRTSPTGRRAPGDLLVVTMTEYEAGLPVLVAFPPETARSLAQTLSEAGWSQFHVAETEKYAHVTYFFNGGVEAAWPGEERLLVPSPKVATYDLQPSMSAPGVTDALVEAIGSGRYDFIVANYANPDMVGHTGVWDATIAALGTVDDCLARVVTAVEAVDSADPDGPGALLAITADHGNADDLRDAEGHPVTAHSLNPVPLLLLGRAAHGRRLRDGVLADVAPTLLELAGLPPWAGMTGHSLLEGGDAAPDGPRLASEP